MSLHGFNLLQGNVRPADSWDKINDWVTNIGRVIVMVVEVIVIASFVARVVIDTQTKNLLERETANSQALAAFRQREVIFRDRQQRFENYKLMWNESSTFAATFADLSTPFPRNTDDLSVTIQGNLISIKGEASATEVRNFENRLKTSNLYSDVQVTDLERVIATGGQQSSGERFNFGIRILLREDSIKARTKLETDLKTI